MLPLVWRKLLTRQTRGTRRKGRPSSFRPRVETLEERQLLSVFVVTDSGDSSATGTLRAAILAANQNPGADTIQFNLQPNPAIGEGIQPIFVQSPLPTLADPVLIDGTSQPGWVGRPVIVLDGGEAGANVNGLTTSADGSTIRGLWIRNFQGAGIVLASDQNVVAGDYLGSITSTATPNGTGIFVPYGSNNTVGGTSPLDRNIISGNQDGGVYILGGHATANVIEGNYIGTDVTGFGSSVLGNQFGGIVVNAATANTIGGTIPGAGNLISNNLNSGIWLVNAADDNQVLGNFIGTGVNGFGAHGNQGEGILVDGSSGNTIGGETAGARNVIAANAFAGIFMADSSATGPGTTGNAIEGNYIGVAADGKTALPNQAQGVYLLATGAGFPITGNVIGGTVSGAGNVISGNAGDGILVQGSDTFGNLIQGNRIGTTADGTAALANQRGVEIDGGASGNTVGGTAAGAGNLISGNTYSGVYLHDQGTSGNLIQGNRIGTDATGTKKLPNSTFGVALWDGASGNTVGGTAPGAGNLISGNSGSGINLSFPGTNANVIQGNKIGTDISGTKALGNVNDGITLYQAGYNTIGGTAPGAGNLISGNGFTGIQIEDAPPVAAPPGTNSGGLTLTQDGINAGFSLASFVSGYSQRGDGLGPLGIGFPASGGVLVSDTLGYVRFYQNDRDGYFDPKEATTTTNYGATYAGGIARLGNQLYMTQPGLHRVIQINDDGTTPTTPVVVASNFLNPVALVADPLTNHLFVSNAGGPIQEIDPATGTVTVFSNSLADGLAFDAASNTLFASLYTDPNADGHVQGYDATTRALVFDSGFVPGKPDGVAVGSGLLAGNLFVNTNAGTLIEINLGTRSQTVLASGGTRGDLVSVDGNTNSILLTQADRVVRLRAAGGGSFAGGSMAGGFTLTAPAQAAGFTVSTFASGFPDGNYYPGPNDYLGPVGVGFAGTNGVLVSDILGGVYSFNSDSDGQSAPAAATTYPQNQAEGIAQVGSTLYMAMGEAGQVAEVDASGKVLQVIVKLPNPASLAADPRTGHLFVSTYQGPIYDVDPVARTATVLANISVNGLALEPGSNTLYVTPAGGQNVVGLDAQTGAVVFDSGPLPGGDVPRQVTGVAVGSGLLAGNVFAGTSLGELFEINLATKVSLLLALRGSRIGQLMADPFTGTLLVTESDRILRLSPPTGAGLIGGVRAEDNVVEGNLIGTAASGTAALPNPFGGIYVDQRAASNLIGGTAAGAGNVISGNGTAGSYPGFWILQPGTLGNRVQGNFIGATATGAALGNAGSGVYVSQGAAGNVVGGSASGAGNTIAFNLLQGINLIADAGPDNAILSNSIHDNQGLGLDLGNNGVTANDSSGHFGPNNYQNFPVLTAAQITFPDPSAKPDPRRLTVTGTLDSTPSTSFTVQIFASPDGSGQGRVLLGTATVLTNAAGHASLSATVAAPPPPDFYFTATATDPNGNTSEFSPVLKAPVAHLVLTQTASPDPVALGGRLTYTLVVTNDGPQDEPFGGFVADALPVGAVFVDSSIPANHPANLPGAATFVLPAIAAGAQFSFTLTVTPTTVEQVRSQTSGTLTNSANTTSDFFNPSSTDAATRLTSTVTLTPSQAFAAQVYLDLLHRPADGGGLSYWVAGLDDPNPTTRVSRALVAQAIESSDEYRALVIEGLYQKLLRRSASDDATHSAGTDVGFWLGQYKTVPGFTAEQLEADILASPEYFGQRGGLSDGGWLRAVYQDVLGRNLDDNGAKTWLPMLVNPPPGVSADAERLAVAQAVLHSPESDAHQVQALFGQFLHREADPGGLATFANALQAGESNETVEAAILGSDEYFANLGKGR